MSDLREIVATEDRFQLPTYHKLPVALVRGRGTRVWDSEGREYLDFYGGHCVALLGHAPAPVVAAIREQSERLLFYSNVAYSPVRARAAELLARLGPDGLARTFFCNSGTEANETALKLARAWTGKTGIVATEGGFHGRTLGSLAVTSEARYRQPYRAVLPPGARFVPFGDAAAVERTLTHDDDIAAVIVEPIQSLAGVVTAPDRYFRELRELCDRHRVALVFDEVQTGVGRTGSFTMAQGLGVTPDLITLAKSLGAGVPVGAVLVSEEIAAGVEPGDHGSTFGGGMLAMAAVVATLETIHDHGLMARAPQVFRRLHRGLTAPGGDSGADGSRSIRVRGRGCLLGVVGARPVAPLLAQLRDRGVLAGGAVDPRVLRLMPPLTVTDAEIDLFLERARPILAPAGAP